MIINSIYAAARGKNKLLAIFFLGKVKNILKSYHVSLLIREGVQNTGPYTGFGSQVNDHVNRFADLDGFRRFAPRLGPLDLSPLFAFFTLQIAAYIVTQVLDGFRPAG